MMYETKRAMEMLKTIADSSDDSPYLQCYLHQGDANLPNMEFENADRHRFSILEQGPVTAGEMLHIKELYKEGFIDHDGQRVYATQKGVKEFNLYYSRPFQYKYRFREFVRIVEQYWKSLLILTIAILGYFYGR